MSKEEDFDLRTITLENWKISEIEELREKGEEISCRVYVQVTTCWFKMTSPLVPNT